MSFLVVDAGGHTTKVFDGQRITVFPSVISYDWRQRNLLDETERGPFDFEWSFNGEQGFAGTLAQQESDCADSQKGDTKAHPEAALRVLLALHQFSTNPFPSIVVGQPIIKHNPNEKGIIKSMLQQRHEITVNKQTRTIYVKRCEVAAEGVSAGLLIPGGGTIRVIDIGSGTVNFGTLIDRKFNDLGSFSLSKGIETVVGGANALARLIGRRAIAGGWAGNDRVYLCGGGAEQSLELLRSYFPKVEMIPGDPVTANVRAFWLIARKLYGGI